MMKLSFSRLDLYLQCPLKYKYRYIDKIKEKPSPYAAFGLSIHRTIQQFFTHPEGVPTIYDLYNYLEASWVREGYTSPKEEASFKENAKKMLTKFYQDNIFNYLKACTVEQYFEVHTNDFIINGYIDQVNKRGNTYEVVEYKTSKNGKSMEEAEKDLQIATYHLAFKSIYGFPPNQVIYYNVRSGVKLGIKVTPQMEEFVMQSYKDIASGILAERFHFQVGIHCHWCDYQKICPDREGVSGGQINFPF
ncbi:MAG: hypothetical protein DDT22_00561 [candidate division WS2 bacterium]|nr:hypothetical protein [Candidatus Lithacetigena glycinireducens]